MKDDNLTHWNALADTIQDDRLVTHRDFNQKQMELEMLQPHLSKGMTVLEVGCGNGFVTRFLCDHVKHVDGFDPSQGMIDRCMAEVSATNKNVFIDRLPAPASHEIKPSYDAVISIRVLINLMTREDQYRAIKWIASKLRKGGLFLLAEGFQDGLNRINKIRKQVGLEKINTPTFNNNLELVDFEKQIGKHFHIIDKKGIGVYDLLTRVYYPLVQGKGPVEYNTVFHKSAYDLWRAVGDTMPEYSRLFFYLLVKK